MNLRISLCHKAKYWPWKMKICKVLLEGGLEIVPFFMNDNTITAYFLTDISQAQFHFFYLHSFSLDSEYLWSINCTKIQLAWSYHFQKISQNGLKNIKENKNKIFEKCEQWMSNTWKLKLIVLFLVTNEVFQGNYLLSGLY